METRAHHLLIGLFTVGTVLAALVFTLWLNGSGDEGDFKTYDVLFDEAVSGLSNGSTVEYKGIKIGTVQDLRLDPTNMRRVRARIRVEPVAPIFTDTRARLHTAGITGLSTITLTEGTGEPLAPRPGEILVIPTELSSLSKLLDSGEDAMTNVNRTLIHVQALFSENNLANVARTLENLERATSALSAGQEDMRQTLEQLSRASKQANVVLGETSQLIQDARRLLDGPGQGVFDSAQRSMVSLEHAMQSLDKLLADNRVPLDTGLKALADLGSAVTELRSTLASLRTIARRLEERPADYLLGLEPTREFKP
ncbi:MAG: MlaD family protein [Azoarcus sp.]|jgi:phospholipid/cholesterol/gamma-HCH transport system substrate-binding protein|nr:MlaD family protein [Azoarcus sp.]